MTESNGRPPGHTDRVRQLAAELDGSDDDDEITGQDLLEAVRVGAAAATGKHAALKVDPEADRPTPTDPPTPSKAPAPLTIVWVAVSRMPPWGVVLVALAVVVAYVLLRR